MSDKSYFSVFGLVSVGLFTNLRSKQTHVYAHTLKHTQRYRRSAKKPVPKKRKAGQKKKVEVTSEGKVSEEEEELEEEESEEEEEVEIFSLCNISDDRESVLKISKDILKHYNAN